MTNFLGNNLKWKSLLAQWLLFLNCSWLNLILKASSPFLPSHCPYQVTLKVGLLIATHLGNVFLLWYNLWAEISQKWLCFLHFSFKNLSLISKIFKQWNWNNITTRFHRHFYQLRKNHDYPLKCFNTSLNVNFHLHLLLNLYKMILLGLIYIRTSSFSERNNEFYNRMISSSSGNSPVHFRAHLALLFTNFSCSEPQGSEDTLSIVSRPVIKFFFQQQNSFPFLKKKKLPSIYHIHWKDWCWSWNSSTLATWCKELTHLKRPWYWERLKAGEGDGRGWDGWTASPTQWTCVWVDSGSWWWTGRPGMLQFMGSQRVGHVWATELNYHCELLY